MHTSLLKREQSACKLWFFRIPTVKKLMTFVVSIIIITISLCVIYGFISTIAPILCKERKGVFVAVLVSWCDINQQQ